MQFAYDMDRVLQIYQQHAPVVVDVVYNIAWGVKKEVLYLWDIMI